MAARRLSALALGLILAGAAGSYGCALAGSSTVTSLPGAQFHVPKDWAAVKQEPLTQGDSPSDVRIASPSHVVFVVARKRDLPSGPEPDPVQFLQSYTARSTDVDHLNVVAAPSRMDVDGADGGSQVEVSFRTTENMHWFYALSAVRGHVIYLLTIDVIGTSAAPYQSQIRQIFQSFRLVPFADG